MMTMNMMTILVTIFTLWLVMGLSFLTSYADARRKGISFAESLKSLTGILFVCSVAGSLIFLAASVF